MRSALAISLVVALALGAAAPLAAQAPMPPEPPSVQPPSSTSSSAELERVRQALVAEENARLLDHAMWTFVAGAAADWSVTAVCLKVRCEPPGIGYRTSFYMGRGFAEAGTAVAVGLGTDVAVLWLVRRYVAPKNPEAAQFLYYLAGGLRGAFALIKAHDLRTHATRTEAR